MHYLWHVWHVMYSRWWRPVLPPFSCFPVPRSHRWYAITIHLSIYLFIYLSIISIYHIYTSIYTSIYPSYSSIFPSIHNPSFHASSIHTYIHTYIHTTAAAAVDGIIPHASMIWYAAYLSACLRYRGRLCGVRRTRVPRYLRIEL